MIASWEAGLTHGILKSYSAIQMISKQMIKKPPGTRQN